MGTQYRVINETKKEIYGFGIGWHPKASEATGNIACSRFLLFLALVECRGDHIRVINDNNAWDWRSEADITGYSDKDDEMQKLYEEWESNTNNDWKYPYDAEQFMNKYGERLSKETIEELKRLMVEDKL